MLRLPPTNDRGVGAKQALEAGGARRLGNESFFSAPQLERDSLGRSFNARTPR